MSKVLGVRIKELRECTGLTQLELAKHLNVSNSALSQYESGQRIPSDDIKIKIAEFFNVSVDYLLGFSNNRNGLIQNEHPLFSGRSVEKYTVFNSQGIAGAHEREINTDNFKVLNELINTIRDFPVENIEALKNIAEKMK